MPKTNANVRECVQPRCPQMLVYGMPNRKANTSASGIAAQMPAKSSALKLASRENPVTPMVEDTKICPNTDAIFKKVAPAKGTKFPWPVQLIGPDPPNRNQVGNLPLKNIPQPQLHLPTRCKPEIVEKRAGLVRVKSIGWNERVWVH